MYSPSREHSPVHRLHTRNRPRSYRRWLSFGSFSSRSFRLHPVLLIPIFFLGTLFSPYSSTQAAERDRERPEPIYRREDYDYSPAKAFAQPDAPPLDDDDDPVARRPSAAKVYARTRDGADVSEWWDPAETDYDSGPYFEHRGLIYFKSNPHVIDDLDPRPQYPPAARPRRAAVPATKKKQQVVVDLDGRPRRPAPPRDWLRPGQLFLDPNTAGPQRNDPAALKVQPPRRGAQPQAALPARRVPLGQRIPEREKEALKRKIGANAQKAQWAKKQNKPFVPLKPDELVAAEQRRKKELEKKRVELENEKFRQAVWAEVKPGGNKVPQKVLGLDNDNDDEGDQEDSDMSDLEILNAVRDLTELERSQLSREELQVVEELERKYPPTKVRGGLAGEAQERPAVGQRRERGDAAGEGRQGEQEGQKRANFRDRAAGFNPLIPREVQGPAGQQGARGAAVAARAAANGRRGNRGALRKRSLEVDATAGREKGAGEGAEEGEEEDASSQFVRRAIEVDGPEEDSSDLETTATTGAGREAETKPHPISYLISLAEERWESLLMRQSRTLEEAVAEYTRRYGYSPPVGFDSWWRFAMENRVILVDEFDQIHDDFLPFRALTPSEFRTRSKELQTGLEDDNLDGGGGLWMKDSFGLGIKAGQVKKYSNPRRGGEQQDENSDRIEDLMDIVAEFGEMMPEDVELRFSKGDEPRVVISGEARERYESFARQGKFLSAIEANEVLEPSSGLVPWDALCPPNSTARRVAEGLPVDHPRQVVRDGSTRDQRSFVNLDHVEAIDLCRYPELRALNGFTNTWSGPNPYLLYPLFSFSKTSVHSDLLMPSVSNDFYVPVGRDPTWEGKRHNQILWRGETTGTWHGDTTTTAAAARSRGWRSSQRARLVTFANARPDDDDAREDGRGEESVVHFCVPPSSSRNKKKTRGGAGGGVEGLDEGSMRRTSALTTSLTSFYLDVAYEGPTPVQCSPDACAELRNGRDVRWHLEEIGGNVVMTAEEENQYKYVLDVDANYPSGKFKRLMSSRSLVLKSTIFQEWWSKRIMPWYHYVPIKSDYSDLLDVAAYFIGAPDGTGSHDHVAKKLAARGAKWSHEHFREVDMAAYMFRLYLEYARLLHRDENDPTSMDYTP